MKKILLYLIAILTPFIFISKVNATSIPVPYNKWQVYAGGGRIYSNQFVTFGAWNNMSLYVNSYDFEGEFVEVFAKVSICADAKITNASAGSQVQGLRYESTSMRCSYANSGYTGGRVINFYLTLGDIGLIDGYYYWNTTFEDPNAYVSVQVIEVQFADTEFQSNIADDTIINQNDTLINQNETIIKGQENIFNKEQEIKEEQEKTNQALSGESNDESSSSCGVVCKLKNLLSYINPLSEKFFAYKLVELLIEALKSLIVPDDMSFVTDFVDALESKLGFIGTIPAQVIEFAINLVSTSWTEFKSISFPSISIFGYNFWNSQEIDLTEAINIFKPFKYVTDCICVVLCVRTLNKWREQFTGGSSE